MGQTIEGFFILAVIIVAVAYSKNKKAQKIATLKSNYSHALKGHDKGAALAAGRAYYANLRKDGKLTIYDEQAITNDIATMQQVTVTIVNTEINTHSSTSGK